jgi:ubiquinone/menaquinone biosynthesis C-methylase UbiE
VVINFCQTGAGNEGIQLIERCRLVVGRDYDFQSLQHHATVSRRVRGDITRLPFAKRSFDLVTANKVVEQSTTPKTRSGMSTEFSKPGGMFTFTR